MAYSAVRRWLLLLALGTACADDAVLRADMPQLEDIEGAPAMVQEAAKSVVRIQHPAGGAGTGVFISADGLLLTNNHVLGTGSCAREGCSISVTFQHQRGVLALPARRLFAVPQHVDVGMDVAAVQLFLNESQSERLPTPYFLTIEPHTADELIGQHVTAVGHPLGRLKKWSSGYVLHADGEWFESTIFSLPGGSGSPIVNDAGRIVGLLHRGAEGFDLLTPTSSQVTAIATASGALSAALAEPLPSSVVSLQDKLTVETALPYSDAFLAASTWRVSIGDTPMQFELLLGTACDESLARDDYMSLEALQSAFSPCFTGLSFLECRHDVGNELATVPKECPAATRELWRARLQTVAMKQREFNGSLDLGSISFALEVLAETQSDAERVARENILASLDAAKPSLDFAQASYLAAYGIDNYAGRSTSELFANYASVPFYERYAWDIAISALWLYASDLMKREQALEIVKGLYRNQKVNIGAKLRIEEVLYNSDEL